MHIEYRRGANPNLNVENFFDGWPQRPSQRVFEVLLANSSHVVTAFDTDGGRAVGFAAAISDGVLSAYIPLVEVIPSHRGRGVGSRLVSELCRDLSELCMIDLICDEPLVLFTSGSALSLVAGCRSGTIAI